MNKEEKKEFKKMVAKDCKEMAKKNNINWCELALYLETEKDEGKNEFRLVVNNDNSFYIHPLNKDGKTFDGNLS